MVNRIPLIVSAGMLLLAAFAEWPYGFYQLLRLVVCGTGLYVGLKAHRTGRQSWAWVMGGISVLFNPIFTVTFARETWQPIDFAVGVVFLIAMAALGNAEPPGPG